MIGSPANTTLVAPEALSFSAIVAACVGRVVRSSVYESVVGEAMLTLPACELLRQRRRELGVPGAGGSDVSLTTMN